MVGQAGGGERLPQRTRSHVIADLSVNFVQRFFLEEGHTADPVESDYGYDLTVQTFDADGFIEAGLIYFQVKATEVVSVYSQPSKARFAFSLEARYPRIWSRELMPVLFVLYGVRARRGYWLDVQSHLASRPPLRATAKTFTLYIPQQNVLRRSTIRLMRQEKLRRIADARG